jgi:hypothetical protein
MNPIGPRESHILTYLQELSMEVSEKKREIRDTLVSRGWDPDEAWGQACRFEELALGQALDDSAKLLPLAELADNFMVELHGLN